MTEHYVQQFFIGLCSCAFSIIVLSSIAKTVGLVDTPGGRKWHSGEIPLVGGIAIFCSILVSNIFGMQTEEGLLISFAALLLIGIFDDYFAIGWIYKLSAQVLICGFLVFYSDIYITSLGTLPGGTELLLEETGVVFTIIVMVGLINAINMIDGLDGLAASIILLALVHLVVAMRIIGHPINDAELSLITLLYGSLTAFLFFNFMPVGRKVFLGDAGSTLLGLIVSVLLIKASQSQPITSTLPASVTIWIVALPVLDTLTLIIRRLGEGKSPFSADRNHIHHLILEAGANAKVTLLVILLIASALFWIGLAVSNYSGLVSGIVFVFSPILYLAFIVRPTVNAAQRRAKKKHLAAH